MCLKTGLDTVEKKKNLPLPGIQPRLLGHPVRNLIAIPTELSRLLKHSQSVQNLCGNFTIKVLKMYSREFTIQPVGLHRTENWN
jgi:hypothetical protein